MDHVYRADTIAGRKHTVEGAGRAAALNVSENHGAGLEAGTFLDFAGQQVADAPQAGMAEFVASEVLHYGFSVLRVDVGRELGAFGGDDDTEVPAARVTGTEGVGYLVDVEGLLGNQDHVGSAANAAVHGDPSGVTSHDFDDHDAVVGLRCRVHAVDGSGGNVHSRIKSEGVVGSGEIIVNRLRDSHNHHAFLMQLLRDRKSVIATDGDESLHVVGLQGGNALVKAVRLFGGVRTRCAQDCAALRQDS